MFKIFNYTILILAAITMFVPFVWMISASFKTPAEILSPAFFPEQIQFGNYEQVFETSGIAAWYRNSLVIALISTTSVAFFDSLAGYTFAKYDFPLKKIFFIIILSTLMIPTEMLIIPWYIMSVNMNWTDTLWGIVFPGVITAGGVFLMRQFMRGVPDELIDSARIDGLNEFQIFLRIAVPLSLPAIGALCIFNFIGNWNAFLWPLIVTSTREMMTLPVGIMFFSNETGMEWELIMTGATISVLPLLIITIFFQRYIIEGIQLTGLKG
jgi:multiple sugar transport system permease protein